MRLQARIRARFLGPCVALTLLAGAAGTLAQSPAGMSAQKKAAFVFSTKEKAVSGNVAAQLQLAALFEQGFGVPHDYVQSAFWYRKAADQGNANAQVNLGEQYEDGRGVQQSFTEAAFWYRKAAVQGDADGQNNLANLYANGQGLVRDYVQAASWYRKAADRGSAAAQVQLGSLYDYGQGVPQDYAEAALWYRKAAEQGDSGAQYRLGGLYANGHGFPKNNAEAYFWFDVAAALVKGQDLPAAAERDIIAAKLSPAELSEAQERAAKWFVEHPAPPCIQVSDQTKTCYRTVQEMESVINSQKEKP